MSDVVDPPSLIKVNLIILLGFASLFAVFSNFLPPCLVHLGAAVAGRSPRKNHFASYRVRLLSVPRRQHREETGLAIHLTPCPIFYSCPLQSSHEVFIPAPTLSHSHDHSFPTALILAAPVAAAAAELRAAPAAATTGEAAAHTEESEGGQEDRSQTRGEGGRARRCGPAAGLPRRRGS